MATLAIFYMNAQIIGRSAGRTATSAAAYRAGERIVDERTGQAFDYTCRRGEIESQIFSPAGAPAWAQDRGQLWNAVEKAERRADAQVAREIVVAFPKELSKEQQRELIAGYVKEQFVARGMVADAAIHRNPGNPHAHIMLTVRGMGPVGLSSKKNRDWNKPELLEQWRERWAAHTNRALERAGRGERIDHRSLANQGSDRLAQIHLGPDAVALEPRGISTEKGDQNRLVSNHNAVAVDLEKAVDGRFSALLRAGWYPAHAEALGRLELRYTAGRPLSYQSVATLHSEFGGELKQVYDEIHAIRAEEHRLDQAGEVLGYRQKAAEKVERLDRPLARVKRVLSEGARQEYARAKDVFARHNDRTRELGTTSEDELKAQRDHWAERSTKLPTLEEKAEELNRIISQVARALEGFERGQERDQDLLRRARRQQDRGMDRDR